MDEKALLDWKEANKEVYSKFKQDLECSQAQRLFYSLKLIKLKQVVEFTLTYSI